MIGDGDGNGSYSRIKRYRFPHLYMTASLPDFNETML